MDRKATEVITLAIVQQKQQQADAHAQSHEQSVSEATEAEGVSREVQHREETTQDNTPANTQQIDAALTNAAKQPKFLPRGASHKSFAIDTELNVAVGIVPDIVGPRTRTEPYNSQPNELGTGCCSRCKKDFTVEENGKRFKLCLHCRELQRERSRRWQLKTSQKVGACRRCGAQIPEDQNHFVLCPPCRLNLRAKKADRFDNGKCVHCCGINDSTEFKVCTRCRDHDKQRRKMLEERGCCNRCSEKLKGADRSHKVCVPCRSRKKTIAKANSETTTNGTNNEGSIVSYQQQVAQQLEANLFVHEEAEDD